MTEASDARERLRAAVRKVGRSIAQVRERKDRIGEEATKTALIVPVLSALGWDTTNLDEVFPEYKHKPKANPVDYALLLRREPCLFVEAKPLDTNLDDPKWKNQVVGYASSCGVEWFVLTDGDTYCIYKTRAKGDVDQKLFRRVAVTDTAGEEHVLATLELLSKSKFDTVLEEYWQAESIDRQVQTAAAEAFEEPNGRLVRLLCDITGLKAPEVRKSLQRASIIVDFPPLPAAGLPPREERETPRPGPPGRKPSLRGIAVADLLDARLAKPGDRWRARTKGQEVHAEVTAAGTLLVDGETFRTPSAAACKATGWKAMDGWQFWTFDAGDGSWRKVNELRQQAAGVAAGEGKGLSPGQTSDGGTVTPEDRLEGKPEARVWYAKLLQQTREAVGDFSVHANSKHIVFSNRTAFAVINVHNRDLRVGLRLPVGEADVHPRLRKQPKGVFEGWSALHVSTSVPKDGDVDAELLSLIGQAHRAAG